MLAVDAARYGPPYPFSADELWDKLLILPEIEEGLVTKEAIESALGISLSRTNYVGPGVATVHYARPGVDWYFEVSHIATINTSHFHFSWDGKVILPRTIPVGMCVDTKRAMQSVEARGWILSNETRMDDLPFTNAYHKGKFGLLQLQFNDPKYYSNCIASFRISSLHHTK